MTCAQWHWVRGRETIQVDQANTEWRAASRERLRGAHRMDLLYAWLVVDVDDDDGSEVEESTRDAP